MNMSVPAWGAKSRRKRGPNMLTADHELHLVRSWQQRGDSRARDRLVEAFSPLAAAMAKRFMVGAQAAEHDLVQQANIGLMKAADRFDPDRGFRFSTYAVWWVRAEIQDYKLANMSIVRRPSSADFRKAMANLARLDETMSSDPGIAKADIDRRVAATLGVSIKRLNDLRRQISSADVSLNVPALGDGGEERMARLVDPASTENVNTMHNLDIEKLRGVFVEAIGALPDREREIIMATQLQDPPATLDVLGNRFGISRERVRQLRERGFERLRASMDQKNLGLECLV